MARRGKRRFVVYEKRGGGETVTFLKQRKQSVLDIDAARKAERCRLAVVADEKSKVRGGLDWKTILVLVLVEVELGQKQIDTEKKRRNVYSQLLETAPSMAILKKAYMSREAFSRSGKTTYGFCSISVEYCE